MKFDQKKKKKIEEARKKRKMSRTNFFGMNDCKLSGNLIRIFIFGKRKTELELRNAFEPKIKCNNNHYGVISSKTVA